jgi:hypothetical protein
MKIHPVSLRGSGEADMPDVPETIKLVGTGPAVSKRDLLVALEHLNATLVDGHVRGRAFATAGFRLEPDAGHRTWQRVRDWNEKHGLFDSCSSKEIDGCRTLPGSSEATYEFRGMEMRAQEQAMKHKAVQAMKHVLLGDGRVGMASCGGASIQLGFSGSPKEEFEGCIRDLGDLSPHYDKRRARLGGYTPAAAVNGTSSAFFSFLANHYAPLDLTPDGSDYDVGGLDEMRARYDSWLETQSLANSTNPCISPDTDRYHSAGGLCARIVGKNRTCLKDGWGSYITRLKGRPNPDRETCRESVRTFLQDDVMLNAWHTSTSCRSIASKTLEWEFLSAFSRKGQLGANTDEATAWSSVRHAIDDIKTDPFETLDDLKSSSFGKVLSSILLISFLDRVGISSSAMVQASKADVGNVIMTDSHFQKGWLAQCPPAFSTLPSAPLLETSLSPLATTTLQRMAVPAAMAPDSCRLPEYLEATSGPRTLVDANVTVQVRCGPGFAGAEASWTIKCHNGSFEAVQTKTAGGFLTSTGSPTCNPVICKRPVDELGVWMETAGQGQPPHLPFTQIGFNQTLHLRCAEGYEPSGGPSSLVCKEEGEFVNYGRCAPLGGVGGAWRSRVFHNGLFSLVGLVIVVVVVVAACWRDSKASHGPRIESERLMPGQERPIAQMDME